MTIRASLYRVPEDALTGPLDPSQWELLARTNDPDGGGYESSINISCDAFVANAGDRLVVVLDDPNFPVYDSVVAEAASMETVWECDASLLEPFENNVYYFGYYYGP